MDSGIGIRTPRQAIRILALLVESGMIYILISVSFALVYNYGLSQSFFSSGHNCDLDDHFHVLRTRRGFKHFSDRGYAACGA
jgi:hypothetical protein